MEEKALILVGLPGDFASVKSKLELYFRNKRKSGGEISEIRNYPNDKRKALLIYVEDEAAKSVLEKGPHKVDFKALGVVELQVKPLQEDGVANVKRIKPVPLPRRPLEKEVGFGKSAPNVGEAEPGPFHQEGLQQVCDDNAVSLLVSSDRPIKEDILRLYFEQFTDDIDIRRCGNSQWILKLTSQSDLENILAKKDHDLEGCLMSVQLYDERKAEERLDPRRFILSGFSEDCKCSHLSVFIKSCSKGAEHSWEVLNDGERIAVTFKQDIDVQAFLKKCSSKRLQNLDISASRLEYTDTVLVEGNMENISEEVLRAYFSSRSKGGQVKCMNLDNKPKSVLIEFDNFHVANRVAEEKHNICGVSLCALLYYSSLQQALTGEKPTTPPSPHEFSIPVDALFLEYIQNDEVCREDFESTLKEFNTSISFKADPEIPQVVLEMAVDRESLLLHRLARTWERKTKQAAEALLEKYSIVMLMSTEEVWDRVKDKCLSMNLKTSRVTFESTKNSVVVVGQQNEVKKLQGEIQLLLNKAKEELDVEKNTVERKITVDSKEELDFVWNLVSVKLQGEVQHQKDEVNLTFHLKGLRDKVNAAEGIIKNTKDNLSIQSLHLSPNLTMFLQSLDLKRFECDHFTHISATVFSFGDSIQILSEKQDVEKARDKIKQILTEDVINLTSDQRKVTQEEHWNVFYHGIMQEVESSNNTRNIKISHSGVQIAVCGFQNVVTDVARKLRGYLNNKMPVTEDIQLNALRQVEYIDACMKLSEAPELKALDVTILSSRTQASPCLKVTAASDNIKEAVAAVKRQISNIVHEKHIYSNAGESKVLEKHQDALKAKAKDFACKLYLTVEQASQTSSHLSCTFKMGNCLTLTIAQGELSRQSAEAVICPLSGNMSFDNPVVKKIVQVGGPQVKDVVDKLLTESHVLVAGDIVAGNPGKLSAKALIYAIVPTWNNTSKTEFSGLLETRYLASSVQRSLQNAESKHCVSMVMPALGCGAFGFPVRGSCEVIETEIAEFCNSHCDTPPHLREIFIVDSDAKTVEEFHTVLKEKGYQSTDSTDTMLSVRPAKTSKQATAPPPRLPKPGSDCIVDIGGITVILKKGDITEEAVDAIVNSNNKSLNLDTGVSGAILKAAGQSVQDECAKLGTQNEDGVVVTGGGNLKCKHIIQMVGPTTTAGITTSTERVLQLCESKNTTAVSFPAIGTGRGNIKPEESIKAILKGLENHLSQTISTTIKFLSIVAFEQTLFDTFCHYIAERNQQSQQSKEAVTGFCLPSIPSRSMQLPANQVVIGGVTVSLKKGDITNEAVDAIVNSTSASLNLDTGVSGAILKAAGESVVNECANLGTQKEDGVVVTGGGNLKCKHIIQMVGPTTTAGITTSTERVLQLCESKNTTAVSFPAIGTGRGNIKPEESIKAILKGLQNHLSQTTSTTIKFIFIVTFEQKVFDSFCHYFEERNQQSLQRKEAVTGFHLPSIQSRSMQLPANQVKIHGIRIEVKKGDITRETVRGIVNTTNNELNLKGGVSGAIFRAAGNLVEEECKTFGPQQDDGVVVTSGGALQCDFIIHMVGPRSSAAATSQVEKVLEQCEKNNITTVSFPAIGTGGGKLSAADVIDAMLLGFHNHLSQHISTVLKLMYIVVHEDKILQDFLQGLKQWSIPELDTSDEEEDDMELSTTSELDTEDEDMDEDDNEGSIEIIMGPIKVKVLCGDITQETTDVIVSSTNTSLDLSSGVSGAILKAAGQTVLDECRALGTQPKDGVVITKPGNLKCKDIVHMVGQTKERDITNSMCKVLETCDRIKAQTVAFPALGTGAGNLTASQVANAMTDAISYFILDKPKSSITAVNIVIFQPKMISDFGQVMKKFKRVTPMPGVAGEIAAHRRLPTPPSSSLSQTNSNIPSQSLESMTADISFPVMVAEVYGASVANLAQVKKCLDDLISEECTSQDVVDNHLHFLAEKDKQDIVETSQKHQVHISMLRNRLTVSGKREDVLFVVMQIKDSLQRTQEREGQKREERRIWQTVRWKLGRSDAWTGLKKQINCELELAFHKKDKLYTYQNEKGKFAVDFEKMEQTDSRGQISRIKRTPFSDSETAIITTPPTWTKMDGKDLDIILLLENSDEFQKLSEGFVQSCQVFTQKNSKKIEVVQIQRIQHQEQWRKYAVSKQALDKKYPKSDNEQLLYHGTTKDICQKINKNGFNRSFCGRNATMYGCGTYFAKEAHYSCYDQYSNPDGNGHKYIYRARVLTGKPCLGQQGMKEPSPVDPNNLQAGLHDCAVDKLQNPFIFVIFCDSGAYPEYLITFKTV